MSGIMLDAPAEVVDYHLNKLLNGEKKNYYRFQPELNPQNEASDNTSDQNISELLSIAKTFIKNKSKTIDKLCQKLLENKGM